MISWKNFNKFGFFAFLYLWINLFIVFIVNKVAGLLLVFFLLFFFVLIPIALGISLYQGFIYKEVKENAK